MAVEDRRALFGITARPCSVDHQRDVMDGPEQQPSRQTPEPPVDRPPGRKMDRQHSPLAARSHKTTNGVQDVTQIGPSLAPDPRRLGQKRLHRRPCMDRNHLAGTIGDAANAVFAAVGYDFRRPLAWMRLRLSALWIALVVANQQIQAYRAA